MPDINENNAFKLHPSTSSPSASIVFTDAAALKVKTLIDEEQNPALKLRVFITGGGCSGFQYGFTFDETQNDDDFVIEKHIPAPVAANKIPFELISVKLLIDSMSYQYLKNATIDYREDEHGAQFVIKNPNAKTTCGCGSSFDVGDDHPHDK